MIKPVIGNTYMTNNHGGLVPKYKNQTFRVLSVVERNEMMYIIFDNPILSGEYTTHNLTFEEWDKYVNMTVEPQRNLNKLSFLYNGF